MPSVENDQQSPAAESGKTESGKTSSAESIPSPPVLPHGSRLPQRGQRWEWNARLAVRSVVAIIVAGGLGSASYLYHSSQAATTFQSRAAAAASQDKHAEQAKWLRRYSLLRPDDAEIVVHLALAADATAEKAQPAHAAAAIENARKQLGSALARVGDGELADKYKEDLRRRFIKQLLKLGGIWFHEAERQVVVLNADSSDPQANKSMALALSGQVAATTYQERRDDKFSKSEDYWNWLSHQKVGEVLFDALEFNQNDLDLLGAMLSIYQSEPDQFDLRGEDAEFRARQLEERISKQLVGIRSNQDSRSKLLLYQFEQSRGGDSADAAIKNLLAVAEDSAKRLMIVDDEAIADAKARGAFEDPPALYWDYLLLVEAVGLSTDPQITLRWLGPLMDLDVVGLIPSQVVENVYLRAGALYVSQNDRQRAIEVWQRGLEKVDPNSLALLGSLALELNQREDTEQSKQMIARFRRGIEEASRRLARATDQEFSRSAKLAYGQQIENAQWRLNVLDASIALRRDDTIKSIHLFKSALDSAGSVPQTEYVQVASQLAALYGQEGLWDQAAIVLDKAIAIAPENAALRAQSAEASMRSGNEQQAIKKWRVAASFDSIESQIAAAQAEFEFQVGKNREEQDFSGVRSAIDGIHKRVLDLKPGDPQLSQASVNRLALLTVLLPPSGTIPEDHFASPRMVASIKKLAEKFPTEQVIQLFAAERLAVLGDEEGSQQAFDRLAAIDGASSSLEATTKARLEAGRGEYLAAAKRMNQQAELDPPNTQKLRRFAAAFALRAGELESAYRSLVAIPSEQHTLSDLFSLAGVARLLPEESEFIGDGETPSTIADQWESKLRQREGDQPSHAEFLKVTRLIEELRNSESRIDRNDPRLAEARKMIRQILTWRPRWGKAISLEGWLFAIEGNPSKAIDQLRLGIAAGDERLQTRQRLWEQLTLLNRDAEAEQEIRAMSIASDSAIDTYATSQIALSMRRGDFKRSLEVAEQGVRDRPDDFLSYVVYCRTATVAAAASESEQEREDLLKRAGRAVGKAAALAEQDEPAIFSARMRLALAGGKEDDIRNELSLIEKSRLAENVKLLLMSQAHISLAEYEEALPLLERADRIQPSTQTRLDLAELYRRLHRPDDEINALRNALRSSPKNTQIRNQLARALVIRDGNDVDWEELSRLLQSSDGTSVSNRLYYAILLSQHGAESEQQQATKILRELIQEQNRGSDDAARVLAALLRKRLRESESVDSVVSQGWVNEIRSLYDSLRQLPSPEVTDLYRYADFLLSNDEKEDLPRIESMLKDLDLMDGGSVAALDISMRYTEKTKGREAIPAVVKDWAESSGDDPMFKDPSAVASIAGASLLNLKFNDEALTWFDKAYTEHPEAESSNTLKNYVIALHKTKRYEKSIEISSEHFRQHDDADSARLLVESLIHDIEKSSQPDIELLINNAMQKFDKDAAFLESVGTLRLQQHRFEDAIELYQRILKIDPFRVRSLNNLAMALSEIPEQAASGIQWIDRAIELAGEHPELLDTKGVVLLKAGRLDEAIGVFAQAIEQSDEPRFRFHLVLALIQLKREDEAEAAWQELDLERLDPSGLTASERETLESMKKNFNSGRL